MKIREKSNEKNKYSDVSPMDINGERIEICGNECLIDGLDGIIEYTPQKIIVAVGKKVISFVGDNLYINSFSHKGAVIDGLILSMEFADAE